MIKNKKILFVFLFIISFFSIPAFASSEYDTLAEFEENYTYYVSFTYANTNYYCFSNYPFSSDVNENDETYIFNSYPSVVVRLHSDSSIYDSNPIQADSEIWYDTILSSNQTGFFNQRGGDDNNSSPGNENNESNNDSERTGFFASVGNWFNSVISGITQGFSNVIQNITSLLDKLNPLSDNFFLNGVINFLSTILSYLNPFSEDFFGYKLADLFSSVLRNIFVPNQNTLKSLVENVKSKFSFIDSIKSQISMFHNFINNIDSNLTFSFSMNNQYFQGNVFIIDLSWFTQFKPFTDSILTAFIYLHFLWSLFIKLPGIINGQTLTYDFNGMIDDISNGGRLKSNSRRT